MAEEPKRGLRKTLDDLVVTLIGTQQQYDQLKGNKISRLLFDAAGLMGGGYLFFNGSISQNLYGFSISLLGSAISAYAITDLAVWCESKGKKPTHIGAFRDWRKERKLLNLRRTKLEKIRTEMQKEKCCRPNFDDLNFGDYSLVYLKQKELNEEQKDKLIYLLKRTHDDSKSLPTVGVELSYSLKLDEKVIELLNEARHVLYNLVPASYSMENKSEVRTLPTNPYTFRWLFEEIKKYLPEDNSTVQVCIGDISEERMPYIFLALYFSNPTCIFPTERSPDLDQIGFPGSYVGQTVNKQGALEMRAQTNYLTFHSSNLTEIANACLYASKLHSIDFKSFKEFKKELIEALKLNQIEIDHYLKCEWPNKVFNNSAYQMPYAFVEKMPEKAKINLEINNFNFKQLTGDEKKKLFELNKKVVSIIEKHINNDVCDIIYRAPLKEVIKGL